MMYPDVSFSTCPNKRYDISTTPEEVVQSGTAFAPLPFDYPMQTQRPTYWACNSTVCPGDDRDSFGEIWVQQMLEKLFVFIDSHRLERSMLLSGPLRT
ncbi:ATP-dependent DNA helicase PIF1 [Fusarium oxysporum f. sp. albedinis]|nr:ATP-dependent DNA helicase PIF1 [Fusarium oxysporum f. sp. albedinis]